VWGAGWDYSTRLHCWKLASEPCVPVFHVRYGAQTSAAFPFLRLVPRFSGSPEPAEPAGPRSLCSLSRPVYLLACARPRLHGVSSAGGYHPVSVPGRRMRRRDTDPNTSNSLLNLHGQSSTRQPSLPAAHYAAAAAARCKNPTACAALVLL